MDVGDVYWDDGHWGINYYYFFFGEGEIKSFFEPASSEMAISHSVRHATKAHGYIRLSSFRWQILNREAHIKINNVMINISLDKSVSIPAIKVKNSCTYLESFLNYS